MLPGAKKDPQQITNSWAKLQRLIEGLSVHEVRHVPGDQGWLTEIFRAEWYPLGGPVVQVFQTRLFPGAVTAWHYHAQCTDRQFASQGHFKIVLYDGRPESSTFGLVNEFHVGDARPSLIIVPPRIWHGAQNLGRSDGSFLNLPTTAYNYEDPDHYRLPQDTPEIPYRWTGDKGSIPRPDERE